MAEPRPLLDSLGREAAEALLQERWADRLLEGERFTLESEKAGTSFYVGVTMHTADHSEKYLLEVGFDGEKSSLDAETVTGLLLDLVDSLVGEYLQEGRMLNVPHEWQEAQFQDEVVRVRGEATRPALDAQADAWLSQNKDD